MEAWRKTGCEVMSQTILGEPYWTSTEIVTLPMLVERTVAAFCEAL
jgi:hypothetical protein